MTTRLTITPAAETFIRRIVRFSGLPAGAGFRLVVTPGGCSGFNAAFSAEPAALPGDETWAHAGLHLFIPAESAALIDGATMDYVDTPVQSGLTFAHAHPSACACSSSAHASAAPTGIATVAISAIGRGRPVVVP